MSASSNSCNMCAIVLDLLWLREQYILTRFWNKSNCSIIVDRPKPANNLWTYGESASFFLLFKCVWEYVCVWNSHAIVASGSPRNTHVFPARTLQTSPPTNTSGRLVVSVCVNVCVRVFERVDIQLPFHHCCGVSRPWCWEPCMCIFLCFCICAYVCVCVCVCVCSDILW